MNTAKVIWREEKLESLQVSADELQPIRFQGQSFDEETGLHYNRFRYFDPDLGMFTTRDPIGLMGGNNVFQYAPNPVGWIDPFGLSPSNLVRYKPQRVTPQSGSRGTAINRAWKDEQALVEANSGTRNWTDAERKIILENRSGSQISSKMSQAGYTGHHINSVNGNGALGKNWAGDPRNIVFLQNANHPSGIDEHLNSRQGHRGNYQNNGRGRLIDRKAMLEQAKSNKC